MPESLLVLLAGAVVLGVAVVVSYNRFVSQRNLVTESWKQIDVELQRRYDLIPNLVASVKGYAAHEAGVLEAVTAARTDALAHATDAPAGRVAPESALTRAVGGVLAVAEQYPDLQASANFVQLSAELANTEDRIAAGRRFYNGNVRAFNTRLGTVPSNLVGKLCGFTAADYFEADDPAVRAVPTVEF